MTQVTVLDPKLKRSQSIVGTNNDGGRPKADFYPTSDPEITRALLRVEPFLSPIWEPACGDGSMARVLAETGQPVFASDLYYYGFDSATHNLDFLETKNLPDGVESIVTNPPFNLAEDFITHAIWGLRVPKLCLLLKLSALEGKRRSKLLEDTGLSTVRVFRNRIQMTRRGEKARGGGMIAFAWFTWYEDWEGPPQISWIETIRA